MDTQGVVDLSSDGRTGALWSPGEHLCELLVLERDDRIDASGTPGRDVTRQNGDPTENDT